MIIPIKISLSLFAETLNVAVFSTKSYGSYHNAIIIFPTDSVDGNTKYSFCKDRISSTTGNYTSILHDENLSQTEVMQKLLKLKDVWKLTLFERKEKVVDVVSSHSNS
jgi:hypothetical protein